MVLSLSITPCLSLFQSLSPIYLKVSDPRLHRPPKPTRAPSRRSMSPTHDSAQSSISTLTQRRSDHCFGFPLIRPIRLRPNSLPLIRPMPSPSPPSQRSPNATQTIALVFRRLDPSALDPLLFLRSNPRQHCPPHWSPALWLVIFYFVCDWWFCLV